MFFVVFVSIIVFFFIRVEQPALRILLRIALIPVIAGISYEIIRLAGRSDNIFVRILSAPGMMLQKLTTKEPDEDMVQVAIASVEAIFDWKAYLKDTFGYEIDDSWLRDTPFEDDDDDEKGEDRGEESRIEEDGEEEDGIKETDKYENVEKPEEEIDGGAIQLEGFAKRDR